MAKLFISYSHKDSDAVDMLHTHLSLLIDDGTVETWFDNRILVGDKIGDSISQNLQDSDLFVALISPNYLSSDYCYQKEFKFALGLHDSGKLRIVPIILEHCDWLNSPFKEIKAAPKDGIPISEWTNKNAAYLNVVSELRRIIKLGFGKNSTILAEHANSPKPQYKVERDFTEVDIITFIRESFDMIRKYFVESINEMNSVDNIQALITDSSKDSFTCLISNRAKIDANCYVTIQIASASFSSRKGITFEFNEKPNTNSMQMNNFYQVGNNNYHLYWSQNTMFNPENAQIMDTKDIAEKIWSKFIKRVGITPF